MNKEQTKLKFIDIKGSDIEINNEFIVNFHKEIEEIVYMDDISYLDAINYYVEKYEIDVDSINLLISPLLKEKLRKEALGLKLIVDEITPNSLF